MNLVYIPIPSEQVEHLFGLSDEALAEHGALRLPAPPSSPCRLTLEDAEPGEPLLLLNQVHQPIGPYRASGPIFVREGVTASAPRLRVPESFRPRLYSARAYASDGWMVDAEVIEGARLEHGLSRLFAHADVTYIHLHHARRGCFACRVKRA
jgi:hypothetical protein